MNSNMKPAIIDVKLAAGSTTSPYYYDVNITQTLCVPVCPDETPVFNPTFTLKGFSPVGTSHYIATIHVEGVIHYIPCNCGSCATKQMIISQDFTIPVLSTTAISDITITYSAPINDVARVACCTCSKTFVSNNALTVTVTTV